MGGHLFSNLNFFALGAEEISIYFEDAKIHFFYINIHYRIL